jgi:hypothetical protein
VRGSWRPLSIASARSGHFILHQIVLDGRVFLPGGTASVSVTLGTPAGDSPPPEEETSRWSDAISAAPADADAVDSALLLALLAPDGKGLLLSSVPAVQFKTATEPVESEPEPVESSEYVSPLSSSPPFRYTKWEPDRTPSLAAFMCTDDFLHLDRIAWAKPPPCAPVHHSITLKFTKHSKEQAEIEF